MKAKASLVLAPEAKGDVGDAYRWYETQSAGLGLEFLRNVEAALDFVRRLPEACPVVHASFRRVLVRRFPFAVVYEYEPDRARCVVYAVFHSSQDPDKWRGRLPQP